MYHAISTIFTATILYLISYLFYRIGFYSLQLHRKLWNSVLAVSFVLAALAGLFLALQISYKWNIPYIKSILKWHVEFGIGLAITGVFHLMWHLDYYGKIFVKTGRKPEKQELQTVSASLIKTNLFVIGFVSSSIQFLLMREIMNVTGGYELITGSFLGSWLIGSAIGASLAGSSELNSLRKINLVFSLSPLISLLLLLFLSRVFLSQGESPSFLAAIIYTFIVLIPFCLVSGFTFIKLITIAGIQQNFVPGKSFSVETLGGIVAGVLIAILTAGLVSTYKLLMLIILLSVIYVLLTFYFRNHNQKFYIKITAAVAATLLIVLNPDLAFRQILLPGLKVTATTDTPYGNITKGIYKGEESLYYNQRLLAYKNDATEREEDIHYAMLQSNSPEKVIVISGSPQSHIQEILKYPVKSVVYIERDPALAKYEMPADSNFDRKIVNVNNDAYTYMRNSSASADVIILLVPPPATLLLNRYYTTEFFGEGKKNLKPGGFFMCSPGPGDNYFNKESLNLCSSVYNSLASNFKNVKPVVGNKLYFIASDTAISLSFCRLTEKRQIKNIYVCSDYLDDDIIAKKSDEVSALFDHTVKPNRSAFPVACFHSQSYQFSKNIGEKIPAIVLLFMVFVLPVTAIKRRYMSMYFSASALAGFEIIILLSLQIMVGNMYQLTGLIIAGLMTGLALGSGTNTGISSAFSLRNKLIILILFYIIFGLIYTLSIQIKSALLSVAFIIFSGFLPALITGNIFRELTNISDGTNTSPAIYGADLAGSAFGFIFISGFAVPVLGIRVSVFLLAALIFGGILFGTIRNKS
jgi:predicted membrane-bound spermidine synthase